MSIEYDGYLEQHRDNVRKGAEWLRTNLTDVLNGYEGFYDEICWGHDSSKNSREEYEAYDAYFYGGRHSKSVEEAFNYAWLHHIHNNPHHWQHWVLINDDPNEGSIALRMPYQYVIEMICDWWAFSWAKDNLYEIFKWYDEHKYYMILHKDTKELVEEILGAIRSKLDGDGE
jgi:hypothetical protein